MVWGLLVLATRLNAELTLRASFDDGIWPVSGFSGGNLTVDRDGKTVRVPDTAQLELVGDLRAEREFISFMPSCGLNRLSPRQTLPLPADAAGWEVKVSQFTRPLWPTFGADWGARWGKEVPEHAMLVFAWLDGMKVRALRVKSMELPEDTNIWGQQAWLPLDDDWLDGQAVVLLWADGHFKRTRPWFSDARLEAAARAMMVGEDEDLLGWLEAGGSAREKGANGVTLAHLAVVAGDYRALNAILKAGGKPSAHLFRDGPTPLHLAVRLGREEAVDLLLKAGCSPGVTSRGEARIISIAIADGQTGIVKRLLSAGADLKARGLYETNAIQEAIDWNRPEIGTLLLSKYRHFDFGEPDLTLVLREKILAGQTDMVAWMLDQGVKLWGKAEGKGMGEDGSTLMAAIKNGADERMVRVLIDHGAEVDESVDGQTALEAAASAGNEAVVKALIAAGAEVNRRDGLGRTALHAAAVADQAGVAELLLAAGADAESRDRDGGTALDDALRTLSPNASRSLEMAGASVSWQAPDADALIDAVLRFDRVGLLTAAMKAGWHAERPLYGRWQATDVAAWYGAEDCLKVLGRSKRDGEASGFVEEPATKTDSKLKPIKVVEPIDPRTWEMRKQEVNFSFRALIDRDGVVRFPILAEGGAGPLARSTLWALGQWRYEPPTCDGKAVDVRVRLPLGFPSRREDTFDISDLDVLPRLVSEDAPSLPDGLKHRGYEEVELECFVNEKGVVDEVNVLTTSDSAYGEAVAAMIRRWRYQPGEIHGKPVRTRIRTSYRLVSTK